MIKIALITEGLTDQIVIKSILRGYFNSDNFTIYSLQPKIYKDNENKSDSGGWTLVFQYCKSNKFKEAFQFNDYVIIQIDTDVSEKKGFDISKHNQNGNELTPEELIEKVKQKFIALIGKDFYRKYYQRIIFAIAVHSTECWLLPLYYQNHKKSEIVDCLETLNQQINKQEKFKIDKNHKNPAYYRIISESFWDNKTLIDCYQDNPSLKVFIEEIKSRNIVIEDDDDW